MLEPEDPHQRAIGRVPQQSIDLLDRDVTGQREDAIRQRRIQQRHAHGHAVQLPLELGVDERDSGR